MNTCPQKSPRFSNPPRPCPPQMGKTKGSGYGEKLNPSENRVKFRMVEENDQREEEEDDDEQSSYEVEAIMDKKVEDNKNHYLVSWKGYPKDQATWQPISNLNNCTDLILEYEMKQLRQQERTEIASFTQSSPPKKPQGMQDTYSPVPIDIYSYNLHVLNNSEPTVAQLERISSELNKQLKQNLPVSAQLISILGFQPNDPDYFRVRARTHSQTRTYRIHKSRLQQQHAQALIEYYQSLIEWD